MSEANGTTPVVNYAKDDQVLRAKVRGAETDVPISEARRLIQMGLASEQSLKEANQLVSSYRSDLDGMTRLASLARSAGIDPVLLKTNPEAAFQALAARHGSGAGNGSPSQTSHEDDADPNTTALRKELVELRTKYDRVDSEVRNLSNANAKTDLERRIDSALGAYPLFTSNVPNRELAKRVVVATWMADSSRSLEEVAGEAHAMFAEARTAEASQERDARVAAEQRNRGINPGQAQPMMSAPPGPEFSAEDRKAGKGPRQWLKDQVGKTWGAVK